jgi:small conductance mechanosensitive channel
MGLQMRSLLRQLSLGLMLALALPAAAQEATEEITADQALQDLLVVLQDDTARAALIARLSEVDPATDTATETATDTATEPATEPGSESLLATQALGYGAGVVAQIRSQIAALERELAPLFSTAYLQGFLTALQPIEIAALGLTIALTVLVQTGLQRIVARWRQRPLVSLQMMARVKGTAVATLWRLGTLAVACLSGGVAAMVMASLSSAMGRELFIFQTLYLTAFGVFGLLRLVVAIFASPEAATGRSLSHAPPILQRETWWAVAWPAGVASFGFLFVLPALRDTIGPAVAGPTRVLVASLALALALRGIWRIIQRQRSLTEPPAPHSSAPATGLPVARPPEILSRLWAWPVGLAIVYCWGVTLTRPDLAPLLVARALGGVGLALIAAGAALRLHQISGHPSVAANTAARRIEVLRAAALRLGTGVLALLAVAGFGGGLGLFDPWAVISDGRVQTAFWRIVSAVLVLAAAGGLWLVLSATLDRWLGAVMEGGADLARRRTLLRLLRNALGIVVTTVALILALAQLGLDVAPLLAGAGVVGIAIGFGAQKLVQDIITGIFIQLENAVNEGDQVDLAGLSGSVERVSIRSIRLRAADGTLHIIPFSSVTTVSNHSRGQRPVAPVQG